MSTVLMSTNASVRDQTKAPGDHGSVIAAWSIVLVLICLAAIISLLGSPQDPGLLELPGWKLPLGVLS